MIKTEKEFYCLLKTAIDEKIGESKKDFSKVHNISRASYYNISKICEGNKGYPRLSVSKIEKLCIELGIDFEEVYFKLKSN